VTAHLVTADATQEEILNAAMVVETTAAGLNPPSRQKVVARDQEKQHHLQREPPGAGVADLYRGAVAGGSGPQPAFPHAHNLNSLLTNTAILAILAIGMMLVLVTRGIDLSIGSIMAFTGMVTAIAVARHPDIHPLLAVLEGTVIGMVIGVISGVLIARFDVLPVIATLGMMNVVRGLTYVVSGGRWISSYQMSTEFKAIATGRTLGINNLIMIAIVIYVIAAYFIGHTPHGGVAYMRSDPIPQQRRYREYRSDALSCWSTRSWVPFRGLPACCGSRSSHQLRAIQPSATSYRLIAACILGGVSITGGVGKLSGLLLGTIMLGILANALPLINVSPFWQMGIQGIVVLAAVLTNVLVRRNTERTALRRRAI
jgi:rhamnose transport system permease protein